MYFLKIGMLCSDSGARGNRDSFQLFQTIYKQITTSQKFLNKYLDAR